MDFPLIPLPREFYLPSAKKVAPRLLGHLLVRQTPKGRVAGFIVESEAYLHNDPACHAASGETPRNKSMWGEQGRSYVYLIYGYHFCFNAVCQPAGRPEAVLVRAIEPAIGAELMQENRPVSKLIDLTNGPAKFCAAMGITRFHDGLDLCDPGSQLFIAANPQLTSYRKKFGPIVSTTRIGISKAEDLLLRFYLQNNPYVSRKSKLVYSVR